MAKSIKIGVFLPAMTQFLDVACVDTLGVMSQEYMSQLPPSIRPPAAAQAPSVSVYYITMPGKNNLITLSSGATLIATHLYTDDAVAPGNLDLVVVPGPDPFQKFEKASLEWLKSHADTPNVDILSICTGAFLVAAAGITDGKKASGPRFMQDDLVRMYPGTQWVGGEYRWVRDGSLWSSGMLRRCFLNVVFLY